MNEGLSERRIYDVLHDADAICAYVKAYRRRNWRQQARWMVELAALLLFIPLVAFALGTVSVRSSTE